MFVFIAVTHRLAREPRYAEEMMLKTHTMNFVLSTPFSKVAAG